MPKPRKGESKNEYLSRCFNDAHMKKTVPNKKKRKAICYKYWNNKNKK